MQAIGNIISNFSQAKYYLNFNSKAELAIKTRQKTQKKKTQKTHLKNPSQSGVFGSFGVFLYMNTYKKNTVYFSESTCNSQWTYGEKYSKYINDPKLHIFQTYYLGELTIQKPL